MKNKIGAIIISILLAVGLLFITATYQVGEWQQAVVLKFGRPIRTVTEPGLHFKTPFVHNVVYFEKRLLGYDAAPRELLTRDKQQLVVDNFSRWEIVDPLKFYQTVITQAGAQSRLDDIIYSNLRQVIGQVTLREVVSGDRETLMRPVTSKSNTRAAEYGIGVVDVRIKRTELPEKNELNVFGRMRTERERQAKKFRAEGEEESTKIRSQAEREKRVILAESTRQAEIIRGGGDAKTVDIYAKAYQRDPDFFAFVRTLEAYREALGSDTMVVLSPSSEFLELFQDSGD